MAARKGSGRGKSRCSVGGRACIPSGSAPALPLTCSTPRPGTREHQALRGVIQALRKNSSYLLLGAGAEFSLMITSTDAAPPSAGARAR